MNAIDSRRVKRSERTVKTLLVDSSPPVAVYGMNTIVAMRGTVTDRRARFTARINPEWKMTFDSSLPS